MSDSSNLRTKIATHHYAMCFPQVVQHKEVCYWGRSAAYLQCPVSSYP